MSSAVSIDNLVIALAADSALSLGQAARYATPEAVRLAVGEGLVEVRHEPYRSSAGARRVLAIPVVSLTPAGAGLARTLGIPARPFVRRKLAHVLGLAELRAALRISPHELLPAEDLEALWARLRASGGGLPDGLARQGAFLAALEYDHGSYKAEQVEQKLSLARSLADTVVWGAPTARRAAWLRKQGAEDVRVLRVPLWPDTLA